VDEKCNRVHDFVVRCQNFIGSREKPEYTLLFGRQPAPGLVCYKLPLHLVKRAVDPKILRKAQRIFLPKAFFALFVFSVVAQFLLRKYSAANYPSVFVAMMVYGAFVLPVLARSFGTRLEWSQPEPRLLIPPQAQSEKAVIADSNWTQ
jgi:hypothetical protein